jgi:hypothetical protein
MPTARTVIFVSDGFNRFPGRDLYTVLRSFAPKDRIFEDHHSRDTESELQNILKAATKYDVKFYSLDSRGVYNSQFNPGNIFGRRHFLLNRHANGFAKRALGSHRRNRIGRSRCRHGST